MRLVDDDVERPKKRVTLVARVAPGLQVGAEYAPEPDHVVPLLNWRVVSEGPRRPAVILGTSGDRQGVPHGQAYYLTFSKALNGHSPVFAPYVGASYGVEDKLRAIAGLNVVFNESLSALLLHDGVNFHPTLTYSVAGHAFTLMYVSLEDLGFSWSYRF